MKQQDFAALAAQDYNRIPVSREVLADLETPLSAYRKLAEGPYSYFFESVQGGEKWGRYSIIGLPCRTLLKVFGQRVEIWVDGRLSESEEVADPLAFVEAFQQRYRTAPRNDLPVFHGGLVGYFGYDTVRYVEPRLQAGTPPDRLGTPDILLMVSEEVLVFDNLAGTHSPDCECGSCPSITRWNWRSERLAALVAAPARAHASTAGGGIGGGGQRGAGTAGAV